MKSTVTTDDLKVRTKNDAIRVIKIVSSLPRTREVDILARQLVRSATSVGANYRAACRARSRADFINKIGIVEEEADETQYWLELLLESNVIRTTNSIQELLAEYKELTAIFTATGRTAKRNVFSKRGQDTLD